MATEMKPCKTKEDILKRYNNFRAKQRENECYSDVVPIEIFGLKLDRTGAFTFDELCKYL